MKKILLALALLIGTTNAYADTCSKNLMPLFSSFQATKLCSTFTGSSTISASLIPGTDNAYDLGDTTHSMRSLYVATSEIWKTSAIFRVRQDAQRLFTWDGSSDTALTMTFGDGGTTAVQQLVISASTADADDDSSLILAGGGADGGTRGASITLPGEEVSGGSDITYNAGTSDTHIFTIAGTTEEILGNDVIQFGVAAAANAVISTSSVDATDSNVLQLTSASGVGVTRGAYLSLPGNEATGVGAFNLAAGTVASSHSFIDIGSTSSDLVMGYGGSISNVMWKFTVVDGKLSNGSAGGDLQLSTTGTTLSIQEATAGSACSGTLTANGATPVVTSTSCATTGSRIFLQRTGAETGTVNAWISALSNGVSFSITSEAADTGAYNWIIFHEAG